MKLPAKIASLIQQQLERSLKSGHLCIHISDRLIPAIESYMSRRPNERTAIIHAFSKGDESTDARAEEMFIEGGLGKRCGDPLCLYCRSEKIKDRVAGSPLINTEDLKNAAKILGDDMMQSLKWMSKILDGTINSKRSSEMHKKKASFALLSALPMVLTTAALVEDLQKDLAQAIEDRDKYHKLADMLMDEPTPSS